MSEPPILIVGAGLAGLCCARRLLQSGVPFVLVEASDRVGGRVRTEEVAGFRLDVGFQVLLDSYPEVRNQLDLKELKLGKFRSGALIRHDGRFIRLADPWREPQHLISTAFSPVGSLSDKWRLTKLRADVQRDHPDALLERPQTRTAEHLRAKGFSARMIDTFFRPFFAGVFLESELQTSSRKFDYLFRMFATGHASLPAGGMQRIADQLAAPIPAQSLRLGSPVRRLQASEVELESGEVLGASRVILSVDPWNARRFLPETRAISTGSTSVLYFAATEAPVKEPVLILNGEGTGPISSLCVPSQVSSGYAPPGQALISVSLVGDHSSSGQTELAEAVRQQLLSWFGAAVQSWRLLKIFHVPHALPLQTDLPGQRDQARVSVRDNGLVICGDWQDVASIQGAMRSGREAAEHVLAQPIPSSSEFPPRA
jgi:phytoene dehydrogenase-like protein